MKSFSSKSGTWKECSFSSLLFNIILEVLARATKQEKETKGIQMWKEELQWSLFTFGMSLYIENPKYFIYIL